MKMAMEYHTKKNTFQLFTFLITLQTEKKLDLYLNWRLRKSGFPPKLDIITDGWALVVIE